MAEQNEAAFRRMLQKKGQALPPKGDDDKPRFPIAKPDDVKAAVKLHGQVPDGEKPKVRRHIVKCAQKVGGMKHVPSHWNADGSVADKGDS